MYKPFLPSISDVFKLPTFCLVFRAFANVVQKKGLVSTPLLRSLLTRSVRFILFFGIMPNTQ